MRMVQAMLSVFIPAAPVAAAKGARHWWPTLAALGVFWLMILNQQRLEWAVNPVYAYGWAVPALAGCLFWMRWGTRPPAGRPLASGWFLTGSVAALAAYLPVRAIQEANPDWVKINWAMAALWLALVLLALARAGGLAWARHFIFPLLFCFTALPWPVWMEESLMQGLMGLNAVMSAEILTICGVPALAVGNLVQVGDHWVNVEEACSGIRSLQTAFMMSLFLGEFYRLGWRRRVGLLAASFAVAFLVNLGRTIILTHLARSGDVERWHDTVGNAAMVVCLVTLWLLAEAINARRPAGGPPPARAGSAARRAPYTWLGAAGVALMLGTAEGATRGWYHWHERALAAPAAWTLHLPREAPEFAEGEFAERMTALLKFNRGVTAGWRTPEGDRWQMYYLRWDPGRVSRFLSSAHYPTVCLPATGIKLVAETGRWDCPVGAAGISFMTYLFDEGGNDVYVFHAVIEDRAPEQGTALRYRQVSSAERLDSVLRGERNLGQRVLGIALRGPLAPSAAREAVAATLASILEITPAAPAGPLSP